MSGSGPIVFDYAQWTALFPELDGVAKPQAVLYFGLAEEFVANPNPIIGGWNFLTATPVRLTNILYLTTAHIARLLSPQTNGVSVTGGTTPASPLVGRIDSATEGSVSVTADFGDQPANAAWWNQTQYGAMAWKMLAPNRTMRYVAGPRRLYNPPVYGGGRGWGGGWGGW